MEIRASREIRLQGNLRDPRSLNITSHRAVSKLLSRPSLDACSSGVPASGSLQGASDFPSEDAAFARSKRLQSPVDIFDSASDSEDL